MPEIQLSGDNTAQVRAVEEITRGDVRAVFKLADSDGVASVTGQLGMDTVGALQDAVLVRFVTEWTLTDGEGRPLPITMKAVKGLNLRDYNPLASAVAPILAEIMSGQQQETPDPTSGDNSSTSANTDLTND